MAGAYDWSRFYRALCDHGPDVLVGLDDETRQIVTMLAGDTDRFWSDGLQDLLAQGALNGDLRAGVLMTLSAWRENVLAALSDDFGIDLVWSEIKVDDTNPVVDALVSAADTNA